MRSNKSLIYALAGGLLLLPQWALAESSSCNAASCSTAANVQFEVVIPVFLRLRIGSAAAIDTVSFQPAANVVGDTFSQPAASGGDLGAGVLTADIRANGGDVTLSTGLSDVNGLVAGTNYIAWSEIETANATNLTPPVLQNTAVTDVVYSANPGGVVAEGDQWTYSYANNTIPGAGTYTGTVTYTAALP